MQKGTQTKIAGIQDELMHLANQISAEGVPCQQVSHRYARSGTAEKTDSQNKNDGFHKL
jgi:hypothetical protein